jgi:molecular chaperone DnaJ
MAEKKDYYKVLGVAQGATKEDIKKAFHKLAHKHHPDKGGDESKFKEINEAYSVLSDDKKRGEYDTYGQTFSGGSGPGAGFGGFEFSGFQNGVEFDLGDIFDNFFTGGRGGRGRARRGSDISVDVSLTFAEAAFGVERNIIVTKHSTCEECTGTGAKKGSGMIKCTTCAGKGTLHEVRKSVFGSIATNRVCDVCNGVGEVPKEKCPICGGAGVKRGSEEINLAIPAGINDGEMMRLSGKGEAISGGVAGDMYVRIHVETHPTFKRDGHNLRMDLSIKLTDALLGTEYRIQTLDGEVTLTIPAGIAYGEILRIKNKGIPATGTKRGDLLVRVVIKIPEKISRKAKKLIEELKEEGV